MTRGRDRFGCGVGKRTSGQIGQTARMCSTKHLGWIRLWRKKTYPACKGAERLLWNAYGVGMFVVCSLNRREPPLRRCAESAKLCKRTALKFEMRVDL